MHKIKYVFFALLLPSGVCQVCAGLLASATSMFVRTCGLSQNGCVLQKPNFPRRRMASSSENTAVWWIGVHVSAGKVPEEWRMESSSFSFFFFSNQTAADEVSKGHGIHSAYSHLQQPEFRLVAVPQPHHSHCCRCQPIRMSFRSCFDCSFELCTSGYWQFM